MASWRNAQASITFVNALNAAYPARDKSSDGTIGDAAHASRSSDHNPWVKVRGLGVVRARDVDIDGIPAAAIVEELRKLGAAGDPRLAGGGYIIFNRRITSPDFSRWNVYTGSNPHNKHFHISYSQNEAGFDSLAGWPFLGGNPSAPAPAPVGQAPGVVFGEYQDVRPGSRTVRLGSVGSDVKFLQRWHGLTDDGEFGNATDAAVRKTQGRNRLVVDGIVGPATWRLLGVGAGGSPTPTAPAAPPRPHVALPAWWLPAGAYLGNIKGPAASRGGATPAERAIVKAVQQKFIQLGCVQGQSDINSGWADGRWEGATDKAAANWFARFRPGQKYTNRIYRDDYAVLARQ